MGDRGVDQRLLNLWPSIYDPWIDIKKVGEPLAIYFVHVHFLERESSVIMFSFQGTHHLENIKHPYVDTELIGGYFAPMLPTAPNSEYINSGHLEQISPICQFTRFSLLEKNWDLEETVPLTGTKIS